MSTYYLDFELGNDLAGGAILTGVVFDNSGGTTVRGTKVSHGLVDNDVVDITGCTQAYANAGWVITRVNDDTFTLNGALWASFTGADVTGDVKPRGGDSWTRAWKTLTGGPTAARIAPGDTIRIAKTEDPAAIGQDLHWANGLGVVSMGTKIGRIGDNVNYPWFCNINCDGTTQPNVGFQDPLDGTNAMYFYPATAFTTGLMTWQNLSAAIDLTGHTKISLWMKTNTAVTAGDWSMILYSGSIGEVKKGIVFSNPSGTTVRGTYTNHGMATGTVINVTGCTQAYANATWTITNTGANTFTLDGALWASFTGADVTGDGWIQVPGGYTTLATITPTWTTTDTTNFLEYILDIPDPSVLDAVTGVGFLMNQDRGQVIFYVSAIRSFVPITGVLPLTTLDTRDLALWTAAADQTLSLINVQTQSGGIKCLAGTNFTTGVACYKNFASGQDWSSYKYVSMLIYTDRALAVGDLQLVIDDTVDCASPLETINCKIVGANIPQWITFKIVTPANLTSVRSIGFKWTVDPGTNYFRIDSLFLSTGFLGSSLVSDSSTPNHWHGVARYIGSAWMVMGHGGATAFGVPVRSCAANETSAGYYRPYLALGNLASGTHNIMKTGTEGNIITYSGGWNRDDSSHDGETWIGTGSGSGYLLNTAISLSYIMMEKISLVGSTYPFEFSSYTLNNSIFDFPYIGYATAVFGGGNDCYNNNIIIDILVQSAVKVSPANSYKYSATINHISGTDTSSYALYLLGFNHDVTVGDIIGVGTYTPLYLSCFDSRISVASSTGNGINPAGGFATFGNSGNNIITISGDVIGANSGYFIGTCINISQSGGNVINFTKSGAVLQGFLTGAVLGTSYSSRANKICSVEFKLNTTDISTTSYGVDTILDWVKLSSTAKIKFSTNSFDSIVRCQHYNQSLNDHRVYLGNVAGYTNTGPYYTLNTAEAESGDCIDVNFAAYGVAIIPIGWVQLTSGVTNTITLKMKKSAGFNGPVPFLCLDGWTAPTRSATSLTTSYQTYTVASFVPNRSDLARILVTLEGSAGNVYIDTVSIT